MKSFDKGVSFYTEATLRSVVSFPEDDVKCGWCRFLRKDNEGRYRCRLTEEILYSIECIGAGCPLDFGEEAGHE